MRRSALARLKDAGNSANSLESRFDLAYNAAHALCLAALCLAALRWHGYRSGNRYIVFQVEGDLNVDERIVADLIDACGKVAARLDELM